jgi:hypothetical protein
MEETLFRALPVFLLMTLVLILSVLYFIEAQRREKLSREERLYQELLQTLKKWKIERRPADGPLTLMDKVRRDKPVLAAHVAPVMEGLILARFGKTKMTRDQMDSLAKDVRKLRKLNVAR